MGSAKPRGKKLWKHTRSSGRGAGTSSSPGIRAASRATTPSATSSSKSAAPKAERSHLPVILADSCAALRGRLDMDLNQQAARKYRQKAKNNEGRRKRGRRRQWLGENLN